MYMYITALRHAMKRKGGRARAKRVGETPHTYTHTDINMNELNFSTLLYVPFSLSFSRSAASLTRNCIRLSAAADRDVLRVIFSSFNKISSYQFI